MKKKVEYKDITREMLIKRYKDELNDAIQKKYKIKLEYEELYESGLIDEKITILMRLIDELEKE